MGVTKKQVITFLEKKVIENNNTKLKFSSPFIIDNEKVNELGFDDNDLGISNNKWFFPLNELTLKELKEIMNTYKKIKVKENNRRN